MSNYYRSIMKSVGDRVRIGGHRRQEGKREKREFKEGGEGERCVRNIPSNI